MSAFSLDAFENTVSAAVEGASDDHFLLVITEDKADDSVAVAGWTHGEPGDYEEQANQFLRGKFKAALATVVSWSPTELGPSMKSWSVTVVDPDELARFSVYTIRNKRWWRIEPDQAPWFMLSTAGGLRRALLHGSYLPIRSASEPGKDDLLRRPDQAPNPPTDYLGRL